MKQTLACLSLSYGFCLLSLALCETSFVPHRLRRRSTTTTTKKRSFCLLLAAVRFGFVCWVRVGTERRGRRRRRRRERAVAGWLAGFFFFASLRFIGIGLQGRKEGRKEAGVGFVSLAPRLLEMVWERQRCFAEEFGGWVFGWRVFVGFETVGRIRTGVQWDWVLGWRTWGGGEEEAGRRRRRIGSWELHMKGLEKGQKSVEEEEETRSLFLLWVNCGVVLRLARCCCFGDHPSSRTRWWCPLPLMKILCQETVAAVAVFCCKGALSGG